jgi:transcriptional regulator with XRE-family HTH domain
MSGRVSIARRLREQRGWSRERLAAEADLSLATIQRLEAGRYPRVEHLLRVADALGVGVDQLLGRSGPPDSGARGQPFRP